MSQERGEVERVVGDHGGALLAEWGMGVTAVVLALDGVATGEPLFAIPALGYAIGAIILARAIRNSG